MSPIPKLFSDADGNMIPYDKSPLRWRVSVYGLVFNENHELLILKNKNEKLWDVPGGGIEFGETQAETLEREGLEEAGVRLKPIRLILPVEDYFYHREKKQFFQSLQLFFEAEMMGEIGKPTEPTTEHVKFVPLNELGNYGLPPGVWKALAAKP